jgi:hypothetical protein
MRQLSRPLTVRFILSAVAMGVACLGLASTSAVAAPATTTTLPASIVAAGNTYVRHLLDVQPIPLEARAVTSLPTPISPQGDVVGASSIEQTHRFYLLPMSVSVEAYVTAHLPKGEKVTSTGSSNGPGTNSAQFMTVSLTCVSPHILYCGVYYSTTAAKNGEQELRVDAQVIYLPILHVKMPTDGVVTVTGYGKTSLVDGSSDPTSVVLSHSEVHRLRSAISGLKDMGDNGGCMEDSILLKIKFVKNGKVSWSAIADECPGALTITSAKSDPILDNRSCSFWHVVDSFFSASQASATKSDSKICSQSQWD